MEIKERPWDVLISASRGSAYHILTIFRIDEGFTEFYVFDPKKKVEYHTASLLVNDRKNVISSVENMKVETMPIHWNITLSNSTRDNEGSTHEFSFKDKESYQNIHPFVEGMEG
ncbi:MAG: hypothetical protein KGY66_05940 [Candidatus Thermoplasmatota archaeon]|nr:hypothetical protein [Candidatus Thermoplasmatota archaeon]MBS3790440.1 hypothetical protein [Candidatus Thermoplasmatota archaeon]